MNKFNFNETAYLMYDNKPVKGKIISMSIIGACNDMHPKNAEFYAARKLDENQDRTAREIEGDFQDSVMLQIEFNHGRGRTETVYAVQENVYKSPEELQQKTFKNFS